MNTRKKKELRSRIAIFCSVVMMLVGIYPSSIMAGELEAVETEGVTVTPLDAAGSQLDAGEDTANVEGDVSQQLLNCKYEVHTHESTCYDTNGKLICGYADFVVHTHDNKCYDSEGTLVCQLPEVKVHVHDSSCYRTTEVPTTEGHKHSDSCYETKTELTCGKEESTGHTHTDGCYQEKLTCTLAETEGHAHVESCYNENNELICGQEEVAPHTHTAECYENVLVCGLPESEGHTHNESCYTTSQVLICGQEETDDLTDGNGTAEKTLICGKQEIQLHKHNTVCYDANGNLICGKLEILEHQHTDECFTTEQASKPQKANKKQTTDSEAIENLSNAILEAMKTDTTLSEKLMTAYGDEETRQELADQFEVEPETLKALVDQIYEVGGAIGDAMDDGDAELTEQMTEVANDAEILQSLATRFGTTTSIMSLVLGCFFNVQTYALASSTTDSMNPSAWEGSLDTSTEYIGFYDSSYANGIASRLGEDDGLVATPIYILSSSQFARYSYSYYGSSSRVNAGQVIYCFNNSRKWPSSTSDGAFVNWAKGEFINNSGSSTDTNTTYHKLSNATGTDMANAADNEGDISGEELREHMIVIGLLGYGNDLAHLANYLQTKDGSDGQTTLRVLTQYAIWYYTDQKYTDKSGAPITDRMTDAEKVVFDILTKTTLSNDFFTDRNVSGTLDIYLTDGQAYSGDPYQYQNVLAINPVSTGFTLPDSMWTVINARLNGTYTETNQTQTSTTNTSGQYVGVLYGSDITSTYGSAQRLYVVDADTYNNGTETERKNAAKVAYCFNFDLTGPSNDFDGNYYSFHIPASSSFSFYNENTGYTYVYYSADSEYMYCRYYKGNTTSYYYYMGTVKIPYNGRCYYTEIGNASASDFSSNATNARLSGEALRKIIISIGLNGYPHDYSHFNNGKVSDDVFREITQAAIWYYTDSKTFYSSDATESYIFNKLINTVLDDSVINSASSINIYTTDGAAYDGDIDSPYQNLLVVGKEGDVEVPSVTATPTPIPTATPTPIPTATPTPNNSLTISKTVSGDGADTDKEFTFNIYVLKQSTSYSYLSSSYSALTGSYMVTPGTVEETNATAPSITSVNFTSTYTKRAAYSSYNNYFGYAQIKLKHGQSITINDLPSGYWYEIEEVAADGYSSTVSYRPSTSSLYADNDIYEKTSGYAERKVQFLNTKTVYRSLTLSKEVKTTDGSTPDKSQSYSFTIQLSDSTGKALTGSYDVTPGIISGSDATKPSITSLTLTNGQATVSLKHGQTIKIEGLPEIYGYSVQENNIDGFTPSVSVNGVEQVASETGSYVYAVNASGVRKDTTVAFTNTLKAEGKHTLTISKVVKATGTDTIDTTKPFTFTIRLKNGAETAALTGPFNVTSGVVDGTGATKPNYTSLDFANGEETITLKHGQMITIEGLPETYYYLVAETADPDYAPSLSVDGITQTPSAGHNYVYGIEEGNINKDTVLAFTNTKVEKDEPVEVKHTLTLSKEVEAGNLTTTDKSTPFSFTISLKDATGANLSGQYTVTPDIIAGSGATKPSITSLTFTNGQATVSLKHGQMITIEGLPEIYTYDVTENEDSYKENGIQTYKPSYSTNGVKANVAEGYYAPEAAATTDTDTTIAFTNTRIEKSLTLSKVVTTEKTEIDTAAKFKFTIKITDEVTGKAVTGTYKVTDGVVKDTNATAPTYTQLIFNSNGETTVNLSHGQQITVLGLPAKYTFEITEDATSAEGYTPSYKLNENASVAGRTASATLTNLDAKVAFENAKNEVEKSFTLEKMVSGNLADKNKAFIFNLELKAGSTPLKGTYTVTSGTVKDTNATAPAYTSITFDENGKASVQLMHGQKITIEGLPENYICTITEDTKVADGYTIESTLGGLKVTGATRTLDGVDKVTVRYTNTKAAIVPTGLQLNVVPYVMVFGLVAVFAALCLVLKRRHS